MYKKTNCIVTGGAGFIGKGIVSELINRGANVFVLDNFTFGANINDVDKRAKIIKGDIRDPKIFNRIPKIRYHYFFHLAAPSSVILFNEDPIECTDITIRGFMNAAQFAVKNKIRFVYPSTGSLYSGVSQPHSEKAKLEEKALNIYAKNKVFLEKISEIYKDKLNSLGLRIFAGYGPGENHKGKIASVIYSFCQDMSKNKPPIIWGDGTQKRDFMFADDLIDIILTLSINCDEPIVNVGTGKNASFNEIISVINQTLNKSINPTYIEKPNLYLETTLADTTLLRKFYKKDFTPINIGVAKILHTFN